MSQHTPKTTVVKTTREVIDKKLLAALNDNSKVVALLEEHDLDALILALAYAETHATSWRPTFISLREDLTKLRDEAFKK